MSIRFITGLIIFCFLIPCSFSQGVQESGDETGQEKFFRINPLTSFSLGLVHLSTTYPIERYTFPNQDGTFADGGANYYFSGTGSGSFSTFGEFYYDFRANNIEGIRFKKGSVFLRTNSVSLEAGRNNLWLGHSRHGSLLLSNNAEPYTLIRFRTERPFRVPYIGKFDYSFYHGWPRNFNIMGHKLRWYPVSWFEFGLKQTITYSGKYTFSDYLTMFTGREANQRDGIGKADSRASFEFVFDLDFIPKLTSSISKARFYMEYGGEDIYAVWQSPDIQFDKDLWVGPFGFELLDTGLLTGLLLKGNRYEFIAEYAQNYKSHYIFYDPYKGRRQYISSWYRHKAQSYFTNNGAIMGHHMGNSAEMFSLHFTRSFSDFSSSVIFSRRHRWNIERDENRVRFKNGPPERQDSFTGTVSYSYEQFNVSVLLIFNSYRNVDMNPELLRNNPRSGVKAREILGGVVFTLDL